MKLKKIILCAMTVAVVPAMMAGCSGSATSSGDASASADSTATETPAPDDAAVASATVAENIPVLSAGGLGVIKIDMPAADVPATMAGLYDSCKKDRIDHDGDFMTDNGAIDWVYTLSLAGEDAVYLHIDNKMKVAGIVVVTPSVKSAAGVYVGMPDSQLKKIKGLTNDVDVINEYTFYYGDGIEYVMTDGADSSVRLMSVGSTY